jgi:hypothetical protein
MNDIARFCTAESLRGDVIAGAARATLGEPTGVDTLTNVIAHVSYHKKSV